jgi:hypothetical protein
VLRLLILASSISVLLNGNAHPQTKIESAYTDLSGKACKTSKVDKETGAATRRCAGISGFTLLVHDDDERASIDIVTPTKLVLPLNYWDVVTLGFSSVGGKAEWRVADRNGKKIPVGLVVRLNTLDQSDLERPKRRAYYAVSRISEADACVTYKIDASLKNANDEARKAASETNRPCLPPIKTTD